MDYAVTSLCVALGLPYVAASSYGHTAVVDSFPVTDYPRQGRLFEFYVLWLKFVMVGSVIVFSSLVPRLCIRWIGSA